MISARMAFVLTLVPACMAICSPSNAFEFRARWVERVGSVDVPLFADTLISLERTPRRVRLQFGVFDDASGPAPAGGFYGWFDGTLSVDAPAHWSAETRTPGRLSPFTFSQESTANGNPPLPDGDPFEALTEIDATIGVQTRPWGFEPDGSPSPLPLPLVRGRNSFVSVFEITVDPGVSALNYFIHAGGDLLAATEWQTVGVPVPPDPDSGTPGSVMYGAVVAPPVAFESSLYVYVIPAPAHALLFGTAWWSVRRARARGSLTPSTRS